MIGCGSCKFSADGVLLNDINNALISDPLDGIRTILLNDNERSCGVFSSKGNDHFNENDHCVLAEKINQVAREILFKQVNIQPRPLKDINITYDKETTYFFLSAFLKIRSEEPQSDLTGDGGRLISELLRDTYPDLETCFNSVIDIGGQDSSCLEEYFSSFNDRTLVEVNVVAPFLSKRPSSVKFFIGDLNKYFLSDFFSDTLGSKLFLASNFINVFQPGDAWGKLSTINEYMQSGDALAMTTLSYDHAVQLIKKAPATYAFGEELNDIYELKHTGSFYKSCVSAAFADRIAEKFSFSVKVKKEQVSMCKIRKLDGTYLNLPITYNLTIIIKN